MGSRLETIHEFFLNLAGDRELNLNDYDKSPMMLCYMIELYAHRNQYREDGTPYYEHPAQCADSFHTFYGFKADNFDKDLLDELGLPFDGVGEVCLLHDVIEDTDFTIDDIVDIFYDTFHIPFYVEYIEEPLKLITHDKSVDYEDYIDICMTNPISAMAKMLDLQNNLNALTLVSLDEEKYERMQKYLYYIYKINNKYHFIERVSEYREKLKDKFNE